MTGDFHMRMIYSCWTCSPPQQPLKRNLQNISIPGYCLIELLLQRLSSIVFNNWFRFISYQFTGATSQHTVHYTTSKQLATVEEPRVEPELDVVEVSREKSLYLHLYLCILILFYVLITCWCGGQWKLKLCINSMFHTQSHLLQVSFEIPRLEIFLILVVNIIREFPLHFVYLGW